MYQLLPNLSDRNIKRGMTNTARFGVLAQKNRIVHLGYLLSIFFNFVAAFWLAHCFYLYLTTTTITWKGVPPVYSPLNDIIPHRHVVFPAATDRSIYHGPPTDAVDDAWDGLYNISAQLINASENDKLFRPTVPVPDGMGEHGHMVLLDVYHQLHCLNLVRKSLWPKRYPEDMSTRYALASGVILDHLDHCINTIRESIMCNADITPNVWQPRTDGKANEVHFNVVHTCKNYDFVQAWSREHQSQFFEHLNLHLNQTADEVAEKLSHKLGHHHGRRNGPVD